MEEQKVCVCGPNDGQHFVALAPALPLQAAVHWKHSSLRLLIGPPANLVALNLASATIAIVVSYAQITEEFGDR